MIFVIFRFLNVSNFVPKIRVFSLFGSNLCLKLANTSTGSNPLFNSTSTGGTFPASRQTSNVQAIHLWIWSRRGLGGREGLTKYMGGTLHMCFEYMISQTKPKLAAKGSCGDIVSAFCGATRRPNQGITRIFARAKGYQWCTFSIAMWNWVFLFASYS